MNCTPPTSNGPPGPARVAALVWFLALTPPGGAWAEPAPLELLLEPGPQRELVQLVLRNRTDQPQRVYLDSRLAQVELRTEGGRSLGRCPLVARARPDRPDERRFVELPPDAQLAELLDLRFHCFGRRLKRLARADSVRIRYRSSFRYDQRGRRAWTGRLGPVAVTLPALAAGPEPAAVPVGETPASYVGLRLVGSLPDIRRGNEVPVALELRGPARGRLPVLIRPELFGFQLHGPGVAEEGVRCQLPPSGVRPLPDFIDRLGRRRLRFDLARICPPNTFRRSGVYRVQTVFSSSFDGHELGLEAWTGRTDALNFLLRVQRAGERAADPVEIVTSGSGAGH